MRKDISLDKKATHYCKYCGLTMRSRDQLDCPDRDGDLCEPRRSGNKPTRPRKASTVVRFGSSDVHRPHNHSLIPSVYPFDTKVCSLQYSGSSYRLEREGDVPLHLSRSDMRCLRKYAVLPKAKKSEGWSTPLNKIESILVYDKYGWAIKIEELTPEGVSAIEGSYLFVTVGPPERSGRTTYLVFSVPVVDKA
jgi:hypothetical protein